MPQTFEEKKTEVHEKKEEEEEKRNERVEEANKFSSLDLVFILLF